MEIIYYEEGIPGRIAGMRLVMIPDSGEGTSFE
jgi:hypothetical protein